MRDEVERHANKLRKQIALIIVDAVKELSKPQGKGDSVDSYHFADAILALLKEGE